MPLMTESGMPCYAGLAGVQGTLQLTRRWIWSNTQMLSMMMTWALAAWAGMRVVGRRLGAL